AELSRRYDARRLVFWQIAVTAAAGALAAALLERPHIRWTPGFTAALGYTVAFASTVCFLLQMRAQRHMSPARAALIFCFEPLFAALTSWLVLGERLSFGQWTGGALILAGMVLAELPAAAGAARAAPARDAPSLASRRATSASRRRARPGLPRSRSSTKYRNAVCPGPRKRSRWYCVPRVTMTS